MRCQKFPEEDERLARISSIQMMKMNQFILIILTW